MPENEYSYQVVVELSLGVSESLLEQTVSNPENWLKDESATFALTCD
jgi:hypothetical protein